MACHELTRAGHPIRLEPQVFNLLAHVVANSERVVTKDELIAVVWGGRIVSESAITTRINAARMAVGDTGKRQNIIKTIRGAGLRFVAPLAKATANLPTQSGKVAIYVKPIQQIGQHVREFGFAEAVAQQLALRLHQSRWFCVSEQPSSGRYALGGMVRLSGSRLRASLHIEDRTTHLRVWASDLELPFADPLGAEYDFTLRVSEEVVLALERLDVERAFSDPDEELDARALCARGKAHLLQWTEPDIAAALSLFQRAIQREPEFYPAYGLAAYCYVQRQSYGWFKEPTREIAEGLKFARQAAGAGSQDPEVIAKAAHTITALTGDYESGDELTARALAINPHSTAACYARGWIELFRGRTQPALTQLSEALRLGSRDPLRFKVYAAMAYAHFFESRYELAIECSRRAVQMRPGYQTALRAEAASLAFAGRLAESERCMQAVRKHDPTLRVSNLPKVLAFRSPCAAQKYADALQRAGLPE